MNWRGLVLSALLITGPALSQEQSPLVELTNAYLNLAAALEKNNQHAQAIPLYQQVLTLDPHCFNAYQKLADIYRHLEQLEHAITPLKKALSLQPNNVHIMMDLANTLNLIDRPHEALELYQTIIEKHPGAISALYNFGYTLKKMGHYDRAQEIYLQVLAKKPDYAHAHFSLASIYLINGDFQRGFDEYEWRWNAYNETGKRFNCPVWEGQDLTNKTLIVYAEQGLGDTLQFMRFIKHMHTTHPSTKIIVEAQEPLTTLLKLQPYLPHVVSRNENAPYADYQIAMLSLPRLLKTRMNTIPADMPYITPDKKLSDTWKIKLAQDPNIKVGICWQGNAQYTTQALRRAVASKSLALEQFAPLAAIPGVSLYVLQRINGTDQIDQCSFKEKLHTFDSSFDNQHGRFMDSAAVIPHLDLVISVDTGLCHLAGALNTPTWILLPNPNDWRWFLNRDDSPWYPSVRLFRQPTPGDWDNLIQQVTNALQTKIVKKIPLNADNKPDYVKKFMLSLH